MFFQMICDRLASCNISDENRKQLKADVERETDLTSDNDNEQRLIQRDFDCMDEEYEEPWDDENVYDWSVNTSARVASTRGVPIQYDQKLQSMHPPPHNLMHKSASIGFSDAERTDQTFAYNSTFPHEAPFIRSKSCYH